MASYFFKNSPFAKFANFNKKKVFLSFIGISGSIVLYPQLNAGFQIKYDESYYNKKIVQQCPSILQVKLLPGIMGGRFHPTPYLAAGILQAWFGKNSRYHDPNVEFKQEIFELRDGGKISLDWASQQEDVGVQKKNIMLVLLPGLTASSNDPYIRNITTEALDNGYDVVVYHNRGMRIDLTFPDYGHIDQVEDFSNAMKHIISKSPNHTIYAVGHSYGANTLVNYLSKYKNQNVIKAAASIANPFDFEKLGDKLLGTIYDQYLLDNLKTWIKKHSHIFDKELPTHMNLEYEKAISATSIVQFDEFLTRRMLGYKNLVEYYKDISCKPKLKDIEIPMLLMNSKDDPILHHSTIPYEEIEKNPHLFLLVTNNGGHVGWFQGILRPKRWFPKPTVEFLNACTENFKEFDSQIQEVENSNKSQ